MAYGYDQGDIRSFLLEEFNLEPIYYSSEIRQRVSDSWGAVSFDCVLERRRTELVDGCLVFKITTLEVLVGIVTTLVKCSTWKHAKFQFGCPGGFGTPEKSSEVERRMYQVYHLVGSSPSLLSLDVVERSCRKEVELLTQEKLREMVENELRANTSLQTLEVGLWKLTRHVSGGMNEWHTSYRGPCLRTASNEYVVEVHSEFWEIEDVRCSAQCRFIC